MAVDFPDVYLELLCCNSGGKWNNSQTSVLAEETYVPWDPAVYDGTLEAWFEVTAWNLAAPYTLSLVDTTCAVLATITIPTHPNAGEASIHADQHPWTTYRVPITLPTQACMLALLFGPMTPGGPYDDCYLPTARIRIRQTAATKSRVQWPMLAFGTAWDVPGMDRGGVAYIGSWDVRALAYSPGYDAEDPLDSLYGYDTVPIWKFRTEDLDPVTGVEFRVLPGSRGNTGASGWCHAENDAHTTLHVITFQLYYSDDGGATRIPIAGTYHAFATPVHQQPWTFTDVLDPALFTQAGRFFWVLYTADGSWRWDLINTWFDPAGGWADAIFTGYTDTYPGTANPDSIMYYGWVLNKETGSLTSGLYAALFDRDTDTMIAGSELHWPLGLVFGWKSVRIDPGAFVSGHELEVRLYQEANGRYYPYISEAQLFWEFGPIGTFTTWQRVMKGSLNFGWGWGGTGMAGYPTEGQAQYCDDPDGWIGGVYGAGGVATTSRTTYHKVPNDVVTFQACWHLWSFGTYNGIPALSYEYLAAWDGQIDDLTLTDGLWRIDVSMLAPTLADMDAEPLIGKRQMLRSPDITPYMVPDHCYSTLVPDDGIWKQVMDSFLVITLTGTPPPPTTGPSGCPTGMPLDAGSALSGCPASFFDPL